MKGRAAIGRAAWLAAPAFLFCAAASGAPLSEPPSDAAAQIEALNKAAAATLPEAPEKAVIVNMCQNCHTLSWVVRSGATRAGWESRLVRMIRAGAPLTRQEIPALSAYLAKALPAKAPPR